MPRIQIILLLLLSCAAIYVRLGLPYAAFIWMAVLLGMLVHFIIEYFSSAKQDEGTNRFYSAVVYLLLSFLFSYSIFLHFQPLRMLTSASFWQFFDRIILFVVGALSLFALSNLSRAVRSLRKVGGDPLRTFYAQKFALISCALIIIHIPEYKPNYDQQPLRNYPLQKQHTLSDEKLVDQLDSLIISYKKEHQIKGLSIYLRKDSVEYEAHLGFLSEKVNRRPRNTDLYQIASVSKTLTASLYADMLSKGEIDSTDTLGDLFTNAELSGTLQKIPIKRLATHTSGLTRLPPSGVSALFKDMMSPYLFYSEQDFNKDLLSIHQLNSTGYQYSNYGFGLLGHALCKARQTPYSQGRGLLNLMRVRIFQSYGMAQVGISNETESDERIYAGSFAANGKSMPKWENNVLHGMGLFNASLNDMKAYVNGYLKDYQQADFGENYFSWWATQSTQHPISETRTQRLAWIEEKLDESSLYWHNGSTYGNTSFIGFNPTDQTAVAILSNTGSKVDALAFQLIEIINQNMIK